jgi:hypothetical protein
VNLSHSQLSTFRQCQRKWMLSYHRLLEKPPVVGALTLGSAFHAALEMHYKGETVDLDGYYAPIIKAAPPAQKLDVLAEKKQVKAMVEQYLRWAEIADVGRETTGVEAEFEQEIAWSNGEAVVLHGFIDWESEGLVTDHKTAGRGLDPPLPIELSNQGRTYSLVRWLQNPDQPPPDFEFNMVKKLKHTGTGAKAAKPPFHERHRTSYSPVTLDHHRRHVTATARQILKAKSALEAGDSHHDVTPPTAGDHCKFMCDFLSVCNLLDSDPEAAETKLATEFVPKERRDTLEEEAA